MYFLLSLVKNDYVNQQIQKSFFLNKDEIFNDTIELVRRGFLNEKKKLRLEIDLQEMREEYENLHLPARKSRLWQRATSLDV